MTSKLSLIYSDDLPVRIVGLGIDMDLDLAMRLRSFLQMTNVGWVHKDLFDRVYVPLLEGLRAAGITEEELEYSYQWMVDMSHRPA